VAVSRRLADDLIAAYGLPRERVLVIPNGVDPSHFESPPAATRAGSGTTKIAFVGSMYKWQGIGDLIEALQYAQDCELHLAGDGPQRHELAELSKKLEIADRVRFYGRIAPDQLRNFLVGMDAGYAGHSSANGEYFSPLKLWEYVGSALPILATPSADSAELDRAGYPVITFEPNQNGSLSDAVNLLRESRGAMKLMALKTRETVLQRNSWDARLTPILNLIGCQTS
jgi:glycosyltransferase involved in cell wall biosynthesis